MTDLIRRADAIEAVHNWYDKPYKDRKDCIRGVDQIALDIEALPSAEAVQGWIPCSERLPNTNGIYIVTRRISDGFECRNLADACYFDGTSTWHDDTRVNHERKYLADVLAWMPLPKPYKGGDDE